MRIRSFFTALLASVVGLGAATSASAQTAGVTGGGNWSKFSLSPDVPGVTFGRKPGWAAGVFLGSPPEYGVALQPEFLVSVKGTKASSQIGGSFELMYIDIPILFRVFPVQVGRLRVFEFGGPYFSFMVRARGTPNAGGPSLDASDQFKSRDAGFAFGAGADVGRFTFDVRATLGLANIGDPQFTDLTYRNRSISIMGGYRLKYEPR